MTIDDCKTSLESLIVTLGKTDAIGNMIFNEYLAAQAHEAAAIIETHFDSFCYAITALTDLISEAHAEAKKLSDEMTDL